MYPNFPDNKEENSDGVGLARWQKLCFPHRALMYHASTRQHLMSHVDLRKRSASRRQRHHDNNEQQHDDEEKRETTEPVTVVTSLTDELDESDIKINELLISEFKLMNLQMRREIRSLYRLLVIFVLLVLGMAVK